MLTLFLKTFTYIDKFINSRRTKMTFTAKLICFLAFIFYVSFPFLPSYQIFTSLSSLIGLSPSAAYAQVPDVCEARPSGAQAPYDLSIATASNFFGPMLAVIDKYLLTAAGQNKKFRVCHNASGTLVDEINNGNPNGYGLFLAADSAFPTEILQQYGGIFQYIMGIPVLWTTYLANSASLMINNKINTTNVTSLSIADPSVAPYGKAAQNILVFLQQWEDPHDSDPNCGAPIPGPGHSWICQYPNIDLAQKAVDGGDPSVTPPPPKQIAGFVSKAQICSLVIAGTAKYHQFTANFNLPQSGVKVLVNGQQNSVAGDVQAYILGSDIQSYLVSDWCYAPNTQAKSNKVSFLRSDVLGKFAVSNKYIQQNNLGCKRNQQISYNIDLSTE
jgi:ABC-type molybdate transport system substrate-binding protein